MVRGTVDRAVRLSSERRGRCSTALYLSGRPRVEFAFCPEYPRGTEVEINGESVVVRGARDPGTAARARQLEKLFSLSKGNLPFDFYAAASKKWPDDCGDRYESNPFCLKALDPKDSQMFEKIAMSLTISTFSERISEVTEAAVSELESVEASDGSTWTPYAVLEQGVRRRLAAVGHPLGLGELSAYLRFSPQVFYASEPVKGASPVALRRSYECEASIAMSYLSTADLGSPYPATKISGEGLSKEQAEAVEGTLNSPGRFVVITGGPGTGKTTVIRTLVKELVEANPEASVALLAPTGRAAKRALESMGGFPVAASETVAKFTVGSLAGGAQTRARAMSMDMVIVDEASMLDAKLAATLLDHVDLKRAKVVFVGDVDQLPSVSAGAVLKDLISAGAPTYTLKKNFRFSSSECITGNAARINRGEAELKVSESFRVETERVDDTTVCSQILRGGEDVVLVPFRRSTERSPLSAEAINLMLQSVKNPRGAELKWGFRKGDPAIFTRNNYSAGYMNGETGVVAGLDEETGDLVVRVCEGRELLVGSEEDLELGYAMTVHKSQGGEYSSVLVMLDGSGFVDKSSLYTAVTRAKERVRIVESPGAIAAAVKNTASTRRRTVLGLLLSKELK